MEASILNDLIKNILITNLYLIQQSLPKYIFNIRLPKFISTYLTSSNSRFNSFLNTIFTKGMKASLKNNLFFPYTTSRAF